MATNVFDQPIGEPVPSWTPPPVPAPRVLDGRFVRLEPWREEHLGGLFAATCGPDDDALWTYMPNGPYRLVTELRACVEQYARTPDTRAYAIVVDGVVQGLAMFLRAQPGAGTIEVGHIVYGRALARTAAATEAMYLMAREVFALGYRRYEWKCDSLNVASRRAAERLGFTQEGTFRQALVYKGRNRDTTWFAMTDGDWARLAPAYERWLDGVDEHGHQRESLADLTRDALR